MNLLNKHLILESIHEGYKLFDAFTRRSEWLLVRISNGDQRNEVFV